MPGRKKAKDLTTDEALRRLFPKPVVTGLKKLAHQDSEKKPFVSSPSVPSHKKLSR